LALSTVFLVLSTNGNRISDLLQVANVTQVELDEILKAYGLQVKHLSPEVLAMIRKKLKERTP